MGWTPCVGPILGAVLTFAATSEGAFQGTILLGAFSMGMAVPFLLVALGIGSAYERIGNIARYLRVVSIIGGFFLIMLGVMLFFGKLGLLLSWGFAVLKFFGI